MYVGSCLVSLLALFEVGRVSARDNHLRNDDASSDSPDDDSDSHGIDTTITVGGSIASAATPVSSSEETDSIPSISLNATVPSSCVVPKQFTAYSQADLDRFRSCDVVSGDIVFTGDLSEASLPSNIRAIDGSLILYNATSLQSFRADGLRVVSGKLVLRQLTVLDTASFGSLASVNSLQLLTLPQVSQVGMSLRSANEIIISDTALQSIEGFNNLYHVTIFNVNNNRGLSQIDSNLRSVSNALEVSYNGQDAEVKFDDLEWANNITIRDVKEVSFGNLKSVNQSFGVLNTSISELDLDTLYNVGGSFSVVQNDDLVNIDVSNLYTVGGAFVIANNTRLLRIDNTGNLKTVGGALIVTGNFSTFNTHSLATVRGGADVETNSKNFSCDALKSLQKSGRIQGDKFVCKDAGGSSISVSSRKSHDASSTDSDAGVTETESATETSADESSDATGTATDSVYTEMSRSSSSSSSSSRKSKAMGATFAVGNCAFGGILGMLLAFI